jgi:peptidoglycan/LPS O-acetylase OafA/YrhL
MSQVRMVPASRTRKRRTQNGGNGKTMEPDRTTLRFSTNLAALRGIAAAMVVIFHALMVFRLTGFDEPHRQALSAVDTPWEWLTIILLGMTNGHAAVIIFFVLSGVVLTLSYERQRGQGLARLMAYYIKRGARLWPLLAAVAVFAFVLRGFVAGWHEPAAFTSWVNGYFSGDPDRNVLLRNILGLDSSLNYPAWTIYVEIVASVLFPLLFLVSRHRGLTLAVLMATIIVTALGWNYRGFGQYMVCFMAGVALIRYGGPVAQRVLGWPKAARFALVTGAWVMILSVERILSPHTHMDPLTVLVFTLGGTIIVTHLTFTAPIVALSRKPLQWLGEISYGLYLLHFPVLIALATISTPLFEPLLSLGQGGALAANLLLAVATFAVTLPLAALSYHLFERPCQDLGRIIAERVAAFSPSGRVTCAPVPLPLCNPREPAE